MNEQRKNKRYDLDKFLPVFDYTTDMPFGQLANLSLDGAMMITPTPVKSSIKIKCRVRFAENILEKDEIIFEAQCLWCRKNISIGKWESGYKIEADAKNKELISFLILGLISGSWGDETIDDVATKEMENRRETHRYEFEKKLPVYETNSYRQLGELADISNCGAKLLSKNPIQTGESVDFRVRLPKTIFQQEYLVFKATCRWTRKQKENGLHESGYEISEISEKDSAIIIHLLIHTAKKKETEKKILVVDKSI